MWQNCKSLLRRKCNNSINKSTFKQPNMQNSDAFKHHSRWPWTFLYGLMILEYCFEEMTSFSFLFLPFCHSSHSCPGWDRPAEWSPCAGWDCGPPEPAAAEHWNHPCDRWRGGHCDLQTIHREPPPPALSEGPESLLWSQKYIFFKIAPGT